MQSLQCVYLKTEQNMFGNSSENIQGYTHSDYHILHVSHLRLLLWPKPAMLGSSTGDKRTSCLAQVSLYQKVLDPSLASVKGPDKSMSFLYCTLCLALPHFSTRAMKT